MLGQRGCTPHWNAFFTACAPSFSSEAKTFERAAAIWPNSTENTSSARIPITALEKGEQAPTATASCTRAAKRGDIREALEWLVVHGADPRILVEAHPHIGTNRLPAVVSAMRETIEQAGGEVRFNTKVVDVLADDGTCQGVVAKSLETGETTEVHGTAVILATGHSARYFDLLHRKRIEVEAKPFALGVRVEHPQDWVNHVQYHGETWKTVCLRRATVLCVR